MEIEQLIEKLENIKWLDKEIEALKLEIESLDSGMYKRNHLSVSPFQKSSNNNAENKIVSTIKLKEDLEERLDRVIEERLESVRMIDKIPYALERTALRLYYVSDLTNWDVAEKLDCSLPTMYRILRKGKERLAKIL
ncbi:DUF1492 domain-containing protein [Streptococcus sp. GS001]|uniref:DUF1492 domain-containing protein n=1 Tax=Streptococcus sp. GS001 TaxID=2766953 RepID=UPI001F29A180|nr:DUF1492 domain-containing protein [Streptococcus sp. GS001]MCF4963916.1 DUF1492 domain-containing protein [Streptococcus sp. GS001]